MVVVQVADLARLDGGERRERHSGAESLGGHRAIGSERRNERAPRQPAHETIDAMSGTRRRFMKRRRNFSLHVVSWVDGSARKSRAITSARFETEPVKSIESFRECTFYARWPAAPRARRAGSAGGATRRTDVRREHVRSRGATRGWDERRVVGGRRPGRRRRSARRIRRARRRRGCFLGCSDRPRRAR